jgi:D-glycero-alpha-D-manno-heptose-7-phosphate kinase
VTSEKLDFSSDVKRELEDNLLLFYTGVNRQADTILAEQKANIDDTTPVLRELKGLAYAARDELLKGNLDAIGAMLDYSWGLKKKLASKISNSGIDELYNLAKNSGALGGKITGAGGGGFLLLYCPHDKRNKVRGALKNFQELPFRLERDGAKVIFNYRR